MFTPEDFDGISGDLVPGLEPLTLRVRSRGAAGAGGDSFAEYALPRGKWKPLTKADVELVGGLQAAERYRTVQVWGDSLDGAAAVPPAALPCPLPKAADAFRDAAGVDWLAERVVVKLLGRVVECLVKRA